MKTFKINNTAKNIKWVNENLTAQDFKIVNNEIIIGYYNEMQRIEIIEAIKNTEYKEVLFDVFFDDNDDSNNKGFKSSLEECQSYINSNNGTNESYFKNYKGGTVSIVNIETGERVFETEIK
jgi:hypothetical protein